MVESGLLEQLREEAARRARQVTSVNEIFTRPRQNGKTSVYGSTTLTDPGVSITDRVFTRITSAEVAIGLDFETWGSRDIRKVGLDNYVNDPEFRVLIGSISSRNERTQGFDEEEFDFVEDYDRAWTELNSNVRAATIIVAHNAGFERLVLARIGIDAGHIQWVDSAVIARAMGASSSLENAAPQLLMSDKMHEGKRLIQRFSVPNLLFGNKPPTWDQVKNDPDWRLYHEYCGIDASLSLRLAYRYGPMVPETEYLYEQLTYQMNRVGWTVDQDSLRDMQRRYKDNKEEGLEWFRGNHDFMGELNLNSLKQLKQWCLDRGIRAKSFDEAHVEKLLQQVQDRLNLPTTSTGALRGHKRTGVLAVRDLLLTKQVLGGSSLKKLDVIERTMGEDGQLRDQYMHLGAGQSYRTTGRGVQMQNLKRLHNKADLNTLVEPSASWTNTELAENLRQLFTASAPMGSLIVGDFAAVESRGLAYLSGSGWKLDAFRNGQDLYKVQASRIFGDPYDDITKDQRQTGKVGELACGYGAGPDSVQSFANKMGVEFSREESVKLVRDWRTINPAIVKLWDRMGQALLEAVVSPMDSVWTVDLAHNMRVEFIHVVTPGSLMKQHPGAKSIGMRLIQDGGLVLTRYFHGCYMRGRDVSYYKPADNVNGALWSATYVDPKTKRSVFHKLYGGKLVGILTQSFCREIFFEVMVKIAKWVETQPGITLIGQFHDEIINDYNPRLASISLEVAQQVIEDLMSNCSYRDFPLAAEVKSDYRYTK